MLTWAYAWFCVQAKSHDPALFFIAMIADAMVLTAIAEAVGKWGAR